MNFYVFLFVVGLGRTFIVDHRLNGHKRSGVLFPIFNFFTLRRFIVVDALSRDAII